MAEAYGRNAQALCLEFKKILDEREGDLCGGSKRQFFTSDLCNVGCGPNTISLLR